MLSEQEQIAVRDQLVRIAQLPVDNFFIDNRTAIAGEMTRASQVRVIMEATIGFLLSIGVIEPALDNNLWYPTELPEHMVPDVQAAVENYRHLTQLVTAPLPVQEL